MTEIPTEGPTSGESVAAGGVDLARDAARAAESESPVETPEAETPSETAEEDTTPETESPESEAAE